MNGYGDLLAEDKGIIENSYLLNPSSHFEPAENPFNKYSTIANPSSHTSPSYGLAKALIGKTDKPVGLLVNARNGSAISWWKKGNTEYNLYQNTLERALEAKKWGDIKAIIWHQGESDSWQYAKHPDMLKAWVKDFRADLGDTNNEIFFVAGELAYWRSSGTSQPFNELLHGIVDFIANSDWISAEGATPWKDFTDPHFDRESALMLGSRYAEKVIAKFYSDNINIEEEEDKPQAEITTNGYHVGISNSGITSEVTVYDISGRNVLNQVFAHQTTLSLPQSGNLYVLALKDENGLIVRKINTR